MLSVNGPWVQAMTLALTKACLDTVLATTTTIVYSLLAPIVGFHHRDVKFHAILGVVMDEDHAAGKPYRSALVINKELGRPGRQFFERARQHGHLIPDTEAGEIAFHSDQLKKLGLT